MLSYRKSQQASLTEKLKKKNVIHVFGASGSGTTMARLCLSAFARVATAGHQRTCGHGALCLSAFARVATRACCQTAVPILALPQRIRAGCDYDFHCILQSPHFFATAHSCGLRRCRSATCRRIASLFATAHSCGLRHFRLFVIVAVASFATAHSCGLRLCKQPHIRGFR